MVSPISFNVNPFRRRKSPAAVVPLERPNLSALAVNETSLPQFVRDCPVAMKYLRLLLVEEGSP